MIASLPPVHVVGRFRPPTDGQTLATEWLANALTGHRDVRRFNTQMPTRDLLGRADGTGLSRVAFFLRSRGRLRRALSETPSAPVLWPAVSPAPLGHARDMLVTLPALRPQQPIAAVLHRAGFESLFRSPATAPSAHRLVRRVGRFVFLSQLLADACAPHVTPEKAVVIPNTISDSVVPPAEALERKRSAREARPAGAPLRLLYLSQVFRTKGFRDVLEAVPRLLARGLTVEADFVGGWESRAVQDEFEAFVRDEGLGGIVRAHGIVADRARVQAFHLAADVFLLPTYYADEAQPLAVLEALAAGTPVVVTAHASIPEMVRSGREARFVPARSATDIADAVAGLADAGVWLAASTDARARFETAFGSNAIRALWLDLLEQLDSHPSPHR